MTAKRAAAYCGGTLLLLAWLASAATAIRQPRDQPPPARPSQNSRTAALAADVQAQTLKLKSRLSAAPVPQEPFRNPFAFAPREIPTTRRERTTPTATPPPPMAPAEPAIELIGVAANEAAGSVTRTAILSALSGELFLVKEGDTIAARYRVKAIGADAVELSDLLSGEVRRLALRD